MIYSATFYLKRKKYVYCTVRIRHFEASRSTKIIVLDPDSWNGRGVTPKRNDIQAERINDQIREYKQKMESILKYNVNNLSFTPDQAFDMFNNEVYKIDTAMPQTLVTAAEYYISSNKKRKSYSINTINKYNHSIDVIKRWLKKEFTYEDLPLALLNSKVAKSFASFMNEKNVSYTSQKAHFTFVRSVITNMLDDFDEIEEIPIRTNPFKNKFLTRKGNNTRILEFLHPEVERVIWEAYEKEENQVYKDWLLLTLLMFNTGISFIDCGYKNGEVIKDINLGDIFRYQRHKSNVEARVILYDDLKKVLSQIRANAIRYQAQFNNWLPVRNFNENEVLNKELYDFEYQRFYHYLRKHLAPVLGRKVSPHMFRHSFAVKMLDMGHSSDAGKTFMGHSSVLTFEKHYGFILNSKILKEKQEILKRKAE